MVALTYHFRQASRTKKGLPAHFTSINLICISGLRLINSAKRGALAPAIDVCLSHRRSLIQGRPTNCFPRHHSLDTT